MPQTLAQLVRAKHPGAYDDLSDQALESSVRAKFPGVYDDLPTTPDDRGNPVFRATNKPVMDSALDFGKEATAGVNPVNIYHALKGIVGDLHGTVRQVGLAQGALYQKAEQSYKDGDYIAAARHMTNYLLPLIGPRLDEAGDYMQQGEYAKGLGATADLGVQALVPKIAGKMTVGTRALLQTTRNPVEASAVAFGESRGIPVDLGTKTGSGYVQDVQKRLSGTVGGASPMERAAAAQAAHLARVGADLAGEANAGGAAVDGVTAGERVQGALKRGVQREHAAATDAYSTLRQLEEQRAVDVPVEDTLTAAQRAQRAQAQVAERTPERAVNDQSLAGSYFKDAVANGYTGSFDDFRALFQERLDEAKPIQEMAAEAHAQEGPGALLNAVAGYGGIGPDAGFPGEIAELWRNTDRFVRNARKQSRNNPRMLPHTFTNGNINGVPGVLKRSGGLSLDDMATSLQQDPQFKHILGPNELLDAIHDAARGNAAPPTIHSALDSIGVRHGARWWDVGDDLSFDPAALEAQGEPSTVRMVPVDLRPTKAALQPLYDRLMQAKEIAPPMGAEAQGLKALHRLMQAPNLAPLSVVDEALGDLKALARGAEMPELRSGGQARAAVAVKQLDAQVRAAAAKAGPDVLAALEEGRAATVRKFAIQDARDVIGGGGAQEPATVYARLTAGKDAGLTKLRALQQHAPEQVPIIARAYLENALTLATAEGGFGHAAKLFADWQRLGTNTKLALFPKPGQIQALDDFFMLAKQLTKNRNTSGTANVANALNMTQVLAYFPAKWTALLMTTPRGVRVLTRAAQVSVNASPAARASAIAQVVRVAQAEGLPVPVMAEKEP